MDGDRWVSLNIEGMTGLRAAIVIDLPIEEDAPARNYMWVSIREDGTKPIVFGFSQLRGDPVPGHERNGVVHISARESRSSRFYQFHVLDYKTILNNSQFDLRRSPNQLARLFVGPIFSWQ